MWDPLDGSLLRSGDTGAVTKALSKPVSDVIGVGTHSDPK